MFSVGQISLEFLLIFSAMLLFVSLSLFSLSFLQDSVFLSFDVLSAKSLSANLDSSSSSMEYLGDGSEKTISVFAFSEWKIYSENGKNFVKIKYKNSQSVVGLPDKFLVNFPATKFFSGKFILYLQKTGGKLVLHYA